MGRVVSTQSIFFFFFFFFFCILHQYECQTLSRMKLQRSTDVEIPTSGAGSSSFPKIRSLVELFGLLVKWSTLLDSNETLDVQRFTSLLDCCKPWAKNSLGPRADLLAHNATSRVLLEVRCFQSSLCLADPH